MKYMNQPLLCVVTINYNSSEHTIEMIKSIKQSDYKNVKIIIVDNASEENDYRKLSQNTENVIVLRSEENLGFSAGNNLGIRHAIEQHADYIMVINNDTIVKNNAISIMMTMVENDNVDVISPKILFYYKDNCINYAGGNLAAYKGGIAIWGLGEHDTGQYNERKEVSFVHGCCVLASTKTWQEVNLWDEKYFLYYEDVALSHGFHYLGKKMWYCPEAIIYHKESASTKKYSDNYQYYLSRNRLMYIRENIKFPINICAYLYTIMYFAKNLKRKNFTWNNVADGIKDFVSGVYGLRK